MYVKDTTKFKNHCSAHTADPLLSLDHKIVDKILKLKPNTTCCWLSFLHYFSSVTSELVCATTQIKSLSDHYRVDIRKVIGRIRPTLIARLARGLRLTASHAVSVVSVNSALRPRAPCSPVERKPEATSNEQESARHAFVIKFYAESGQRRCVWSTKPATW